MKTIVASIKAKIEANNKELHIHEVEKERLMGVAFSIADKKKAEAVYKQAFEENNKALESYHQVRCLRHALASVLDAMHVEYDHFQPEVSC